MIELMPNHTIALISGTFGIPARLALNPKMTKGPQSHPVPTLRLRDIALKMKQIDKEILTASVQHAV